MAAADQLNVRLNEPVHFVVKYKISRKLLTVYELEDIYELTRNAFRSHRDFPRNFKLQFNHKDVHEMIDLDSPVQLLDRENNVLEAFEEVAEARDESESSSTEDEDEDIPVEAVPDEAVPDDRDDESHSMYVGLKKNKDSLSPGKMFCDCRS